jgi:MscS family membrane protein
MAKKAKEAKQIVKMCITMFMNIIPNLRYLLVTALISCAPLSVILTQINPIVSSPYTTIMNHLNNMESRGNSVIIASESFHPNFSAEERIELAKKLKHIYDGYGLRLKNLDIPKSNDWIDTLTNNQHFMPFPSKFPEIYVAKYGEVWYYSPETCSFIDLLYMNIFPTWADELIQYYPNLAQKSLFGIAVWQYIGLVVILLFLTIFHFILSWAVDRILNKSIWESLHISQQNHKVLFKLAKLLSLNILLIVLKNLLPFLALKSGLTSGLLIFINVLQTFLIFWVTIQIITILKIYLIMVAEKTATKMDDQLIPIFIKAIKIIVGIIAFIHLLSLLGVNVTALIAGASIGGLAIALAAQDTFKNLFGSVMVFIDKPFSIGDYITTTDIEGTVEHVGFRSTKIRKIDTSVISVPNGNLANVTITNLGIRKFRLVEMSLNLVYNTPLEKIEAYLTELRTIPTKYDEIQDDTWLIFLRYLSSSSVDIYFRVYIEAYDMKNELGLREKIIFDTISMAKKIGVSFAYPSTSVYVEQWPDDKNIKPNL